MVRARLVSINDIKQIRTVRTNVLSKSYECSKIIINLFIVSVIINLNKIKREFLPSARMQTSHSSNSIEYSCSCYIRFEYIRKAEWILPFLSHFHKPRTTSREIFERLYLLNKTFPNISLWELSYLLNIINTWYKFRSELLGHLLYCACYIFVCLY